jgi:WD40 repeat protein
VTSTKLAITGQQGKRNVWLIFGQDGKVQSIYQPADRTEFANWATWAPDGSKFLSMCNLTEYGHSACMVYINGTVGPVINGKSRWNPSYWSQWSQDGQWFYYIAQAVTTNPTSIYRMNTATGVSELYLSGIHDYTYIGSDGQVGHDYKLEKIDWSPDEQWIILNDSSPKIGLYTGYNGKPVFYVTAVLCDASLECQPMKFGSVAIIGAEWWHPPAEWKR